MNPMNDQHQQTAALIRIETALRRLFGAMAWGLAAVLLWLAALFVLVFVRTANAQELPPGVSAALDEAIATGDYDRVQRIAESQIARRELLRATPGTAGADPFATTPTPGVPAPARVYAPLSFTNVVGPSSVAVAAVLRSPGSHPWRPLGSVRATSRRGGLIEAGATVADGLVRFGMSESFVKLDHDVALATCEVTTPGATVCTSYTSGGTVCAWFGARAWLSIGSTFDAGGGVRGETGVAVCALMMADGDPLSGLWGQLSFGKFHNDVWHLTVTIAARWMPDPHFGFRAELLLPSYTRTRAGGAFVQWAPGHDPGSASLAVEFRDGSWSVLVGAKAIGNGEHRKHGFGFATVEFRG